MHPLLEQYVPLVSFLGQVVGPNYEVCLQDCSDSKSIVAIANGNVSGRTIGAPLTDLALHMIQDQAWKSQDYQCNYTGITSDGRRLRSSTFFLKENGNLIGMLCINHDTSDLEQLCMLAEKLSGNQIASETKANVTAEVPVQETFSRSLNETVSNLISSGMLSIGRNIPAARLTQDEKIQIIRELNHQGIFHVKGAVSQVADCLSCSDATVYRYLSIVNKESERHNR